MGQNDSYDNEVIQREADRGWDRAVSYLLEEKGRLLRIDPHSPGVVEINRDLDLLDWTGRLPQSEKS